jgi:hypothetical protein
MEISKSKTIRIVVCKRIIKKLEKELNDCNPYGYKDCHLIYTELMYWEDLLDLLDLIK